MGISTARRRLCGVLAAIAMAATTVLGIASPAAASATYYFSGPTVGSGSVTFVNSYTVKVTASVWGDDFGPGYLAEGVFFGQNGRYRCTSVVRRNYAVGHLRTYTDTLVCSYANIQQAAIIYLPGYGGEHTDYFTNPYA